MPLVVYTEEEMIEGQNKAVAERDEQWRRWITRIETDFRGSAIDRDTLLFLEGYPPPDRSPVTSAEREMYGFQARDKF